MLIHRRDLDHRNINCGVAVAVEARQLAVAHGDEIAHALGDNLAVDAAAMPGVPGEVLTGVLGLADLGHPHRHAAADLDVLHFTLARGEGLVQKLGEARAEAVVHPVAGPHSLDGLLRRDKFSLIVVHKNSPLVRIAFNVAEFSPLVNRSEAESDLKSCRFAARRIFLLRLRRDSAMLGSV